MDGIYQHFRAEEYAFIDKILGITMQVENEYTPQLTDFLDPRQRFITETVIGGYDEINVQFFWWSGARRTTARTDLSRLLYADRSGF